MEFREIFLDCRELCPNIRELFLDCRELFFGYKYSKLVMNFNECFCWTGNCFRIAGNGFRTPWKIRKLKGTAERSLV